MSINPHFKVGLTGVAFGIKLASVGWPFTAGELLLVVVCCVLFDEILLFDCDCASVDVTVVLETCRDPDDLLPLEEPKTMIFLNMILKYLAKKSLMLVYLSLASFGCLVKMSEAAADLEDFDYGDFLAEVFLY